MRNYGFQNEYDFVEYFNGKYLHELDNNSQMFLKDLFQDVIDNKEVIKSWKNKAPQKTDIFIKYKNHIKNISLKCGKSNTIHNEVIENFRIYLEKLSIPYNVIDKYASYHYGYARDENNKIDFSKTLSSEEYKKLYQDEINIFNNYINKTRIIIDMIDRFIVKGLNSDYDIDALVSGTIDDYVWINKYDLYDLILSKKSLEFTSPHVACMTIGPKKRNLDRQSKNAKDRYVVSIRWNFIREDIVNYKNHINSEFDSSTPNKKTCI